MVNFAAKYSVITIGEAKQVAAGWVTSHYEQENQVRGAFFHGSVNWMDDTTILPPTSDIDIMLVCDGTYATKLGKRLEGGLLIELSSIDKSVFKPVEKISGNYFLAGSFREPTWIFDHDGILDRTTAITRRNFSDPYYIQQRIEHALSNSANYFERSKKDLPLHERVSCWLFARGVLAQVLLVAGLKNPTVRKRYLDARVLLEHHREEGFFEELLALSNFHQISPELAIKHLDNLEKTFDQVTTLVNKSHPFAADLTADARSVAIGGSRELIANGAHREAMFWIIATFCRCMTVVSQQPASEEIQVSQNNFQLLLHDLNLDDAEKFELSNEEYFAFIPSLREVIKRSLQFLFLFLFLP